MHIYLFNIYYVIFINADLLVGLDEREEESQFQVRRASTRPARLQWNRLPFALAAADAISKVNSQSINQMRDFQTKVITGPFN